MCGEEPGVQGHLQGREDLGARRGGAAEHSSKQQSPEPEEHEQRQRSPRSEKPWARELASQGSAGEPQGAVPSPLPS